ncbi:hypothetical protein [Qipengyuania flava]|uniref:hypothetical protein n=1 Tax=Qipengyuania flava TaxID=192812 RepID=UPI003BB18741
MTNLVPYDWAELPSRRELQRRIDNLALPSEHKLALNRVSELTARIGEQVVDIGRRIIAFAFELARQFPGLTFAVLLALVINALLAGVPLLGPLLQPLFAPILLAAGVAIGGLSDLYEGDMRGRVDNLVIEFKRLFG